MSASEITLILVGSTCGSFCGSVIGLIILGIVLHMVDCRRKNTQEEIIEERLKNAV